MVYYSTLPKSAAKTNQIYPITGCQGAIGRNGRQEQELRAARFQGPCRPRALVNREGVENDDIALPRRKAD